MTRMVFRALLLVVTGSYAAGAQQTASDAAAPVAGTAAGPGAAAAASVSFHIERQGLRVPKFTIKADEAGHGSYIAEEVPPANDRYAPAGTAAPPGKAEHIERPIELTPATTSKIFSAARGEKMFHVACASKAKNIADTGMKTLTYEGPDGSGSCTYNYSDRKAIAGLTDIFLAIALTLDEGRVLEFKHRFDHLGLDEELDRLARQVDGGNAIELHTIAPTLRELEGDTQLMQRVRLRAAKLLERSPASVAGAGSGG